MIDGDKVYVFPTKLEQRDDVTKKMSDGIEYDKCGFNARVSCRYKKLIESASFGVIMIDLSGEKALYEFE